MSWAAITATGSGKLEFRVMIEGWPYEFVSAPGMATTTADGRVRVAGLERGGMGFGDSVRPYEALIEGDGMTLTITDRQRDNAVTAAFFTQPTVTTYLTAPLSTSATTVNYSSNEGLTDGRVVHIGTEAILLGTVGASSATGCTRAYWNTIAQAHYTGDADTTALAAVTDQPYTPEGRRAHLYCYGEGDSPTGDGTLVWRGICLTDAKLENDASTWTLTIDPITRLFDQDLGGDLEEPFEPRGIYYSASNPLRIVLGETDSASLVAYTGSTVGTAFVYGHYETEAELVVAINTELAGLITDLSLNMDEARAVVSEGGEGFFVQVTTDAATARYPIVSIYSRCDRWIGSAWHEGEPTRALRDSDDADARTVTTSSTYHTAPNNSLVPRGYLGAPPEGFRLGDEMTLPFGDPEVGDETTYPSSRVYLGSARSIAGFAACRYKLTAAEGEMSEDVGFIPTVDTTDRYVEIPAATAGSALFGPYDRNRPLTMEFLRAYGTGPGTIADMIDSLVSNAPVEANRGGIPFITTSDIPLASWQTEIDAAARGRPYLTQRLFMSGPSGTLAEYLAHHFRAYGVYPKITTDGRIEVVPLRVTTPSTVVDTTIDAVAFLIDSAEYPTWERNALGQFNTIAYGRGYWPFEDEFSSTTSVRDQTAYAIRKSPRVLEVMPKSIVQGDHEGHYSIPFTDFVDAAAPLLGYFGRDYAVVTVSVPLAFIGLVLGSVVALDVAHLPDGLGGRGLAKTGQVIGRRWDLDLGRGVLDIMISYLDVAGYTPSAYISSESNTSGNTWSLTLTSLDPYGVVDMFSGEDALSDHFKAGDAVRVSKWNNGTSGAVAGTIDSVADTGTSPATGTISVTFGSAWTPGADDWTLGYDVAGNASSTQVLYAYVADDTNRIQFATTRAARVYA